MKLWINNFDYNGDLDKVLTRFIGGKDKPVFMKNELEKGLPNLKKQSLREMMKFKKIDTGIIWSR